MRLDPDLLHYGASAVLLKSALKLLSNQSDDFSLDAFARAFGAPIDECAPIVDGIMKDGFLTLNNGTYSFTDSATQLIVAPITKGLDRGEAQILLAKVIQKAKEINATPAYGHTIKKLYVFGSYLTDKEVLGDLDIGYIINVTPGAFTDSQRKLVRNNASTKYGSYSLTKYNQMLRFLKCNNKLVSLHSHEEVISLNTPLTEVFSEG